MTAASLRQQIVVVTFEEGIKSYSLKVEVVGSRIEQVTVEIIQSSFDPHQADLNWQQIERQVNLVKPWSLVSCSTGFVGVGRSEVPLKAWMYVAFVVKTGRTVEKRSAFTTEKLTKETPRMELKGLSGRIHGKRAGSLER